MKQAAKEAFENNMDHNDTMKTIIRAYLSNGECSVNHVLSELNLKRIFPAVYFINTNPSRGKRKYYFLKKKSANYRMIAQIFSRNQILSVI